MRAQKTKTTAVHAGAAVPQSKAMAMSPPVYLASLEGAEACAAFATGMAALRAVLEVQPLSRGDRVVMTSAGYGTTRVLYKTALAARGVELLTIALVEPSAAERIAALQPKFVLAESITNPLI